MMDLTNQPALISFAVSTLVSVLVILYCARVSAQFTKRNDTGAVQAAHMAPTPRIGGLAIITALVVTCWLSGIVDIWSICWLVLLSAAPVFIVGLGEDLAYFASPRRRLFAAAVSGALFMILSGESLVLTHIPGLDWAMQWTPVALAFSLLITVGISHAFNLIDGLNGLAGITALGASLALALIAHQSGLSEHRDLLLIIGAAVVGFLIFNFPFGKIFLGDSGAYFLGHVLVWTSISILWNAPDVTPFAMALIFFWPIADTLLAIARRVYSGKPIAQPDRLHFHQLVMRAVEIVVLGGKNRRISNPLATLVTVPFVVAPMIAGVLLSFDKGRAAMACALFSVFFIASYKLGIWLVPRFRRCARPVPGPASKSNP